MEIIVLTVSECDGWQDNKQDAHEGSVFTHQVMVVLARLDPSFCCKTPRAWNGM